VVCVCVCVCTRARACVAQYCNILNSQLALYPSLYSADKGYFRYVWCAWVLSACALCVCVCECVCVCARVCVQMSRSTTTLSKVNSFYIHLSILHNYLSWVCVCLSKCFFFGVCVCLSECGGCVCMCLCLRADVRSAVTFQIFNFVYFLSTFIRQGRSSLSLSCVCVCVGERKKKELKKNKKINDLATTCTNYDDCRADV